MGGGGKGTVPKVRASTSVRAEEVARLGRVVHHCNNCNASTRGLTEWAARSLQCTNAQHACWSCKLQPKPDSGHELVRLWGKAPA